jgi:hypothetical protein
MHFKKSKSMEKILDCSLTISTRVENLSLWTATKQLHLQCKLDFQTHTQVCVVANKARKKVVMSKFNTPSMHTVITIVLYLNTYSFGC